MTRLARLLNQRPSFTPSDEIPRRLSWERYVTKSAIVKFLKYRTSLRGLEKGRSRRRRRRKKRKKPEKKKRKKKLVRDHCRRTDSFDYSGSALRRTFIGTRLVSQQITYELLLFATSKLIRRH